MKPQDASALHSQQTLFPKLGDMLTLNLLPSPANQAITI